MCTRGLRPLKVGQRLRHLLPGSLVVHDPARIDDLTAVVDDLCKLGVVLILGRMFLTAMPCCEGQVAHRARRAYASELRLVVVYSKRDKGVSASLPSLTGMRTLTSDEPIVDFFKIDVVEVWVRHQLLGHGRVLSDHLGRNCQPRQRLRNGNCTHLLAKKPPLKFSLQRSLDFIEADIAHEPFLPLLHFQTEPSFLAVRVLCREDGYVPQRVFPLGHQLEENYTQSEDIRLRRTVTVIRKNCWRHIACGPAPCSLPLQELLGSKRGRRSGSESEV